MSSSWSLTTVISTLSGEFVLSIQRRISTHLLRTTFNVDDWISHTPKSVLAKNFGLNESVFDSVPSPNPYIFNSTVSTRNVTGPEGALVGNSSYVYHTFQHPSEPVPGQGGELWIIDSRNFPIATTIAATFVKLEPRGLRELHWHPNVRCFKSPHDNMSADIIHRPRSGFTSTVAKHVPPSSSAARPLVPLTFPRVTLASSRTIAVSSPKDCVRILSRNHCAD